MVFVDISGFTKMSERLARKGKVGAEEVTDVIGSVFARLLAVAYAEGGGLIKFGGDALLLLFTGTDHPIKGARAAVGMRQMLRGIGAIETTAGKVTLRMSVGLHSGTFHFFLVGDVHRELIIAGPGASQTVSMEGTATAGEILVSGPTAACLACLPQQTLGQAKGDGVLLRSMPHTLPGQWPTPEGSLEGVDLLSCIPMALREHVLAGVDEPEHRQVTIGFIHFDGTDEMVKETGPELVAYALDELVRVVQSACDKYGVTFLGTDVDKDGGKIILVAGAPTSQGEDEERMLLAARGIIDADTTVPVRIGLNKGPVFAGEIGPPYRRTYTVMGDAVNLAARVMAKAEPRQVLATASVLDASQTRFELVELEPFQVKGKARPVQAWAVGRPIGARGRDRNDVQLDLVGRRAELAALDHALLSALSGSGRLVELVGEPGIGKSRLIEELRGRAEGVPVLHATCEAFTSTTPYVAWRDLLRQLLGLEWEDPDDVVLDRIMDRIRSIDAELEPWLSLIALPFDVEIPPTLEVELLGEEYRRTKLNEVVLEFLRWVAAEPAVMVVEDAHHMDEASADLFHALTGAIQELPWLICVARRPGTSGFIAKDDEDLITLEVGPMDPDDALAMATSATHEDPLTPHYLEAVASRSGGNPQFLLDLLEALATTGSLEHLPDSVESAAMAHIDRLPPSDRTLVRTVSVFGLAFHPRMIGWLASEDAPLSADDAPWERLKELFEDEGGGYLRFRRAVVRDAAYAGLSFRTRRRLHSAVGAHWETEVEDTDEVAGILSLHFGLAGEYEKAWRYARVAARRAEGMFAHVEAATLYARAIDAGRKLTGLGPLQLEAEYEALAEAWWRAGDYQRAVDANAVARKLAKDHVLVEARLVYRRSYIGEQLGRYTEALRWATKGRNLLEGVDTPQAASLRAQLSAWYATVVCAQGHYGAAIAQATRAADEARAAGNQDALARAYNVQDLAGVFGDRYTGGEHWRRALGISEELGDLRLKVIILSNLGIGDFHVGCWADAIHHYSQAADLSRTIGDLVGEHLALANVAELLSNRGIYEEADALLRGSLRVITAVGYREFRGFCSSTLGRNLARMGHFDEAMEILTEARAEYEEIRSQEGVLDCDAKIAECYALRGDPTPALDLATDAIARTRTVEGNAVEAMLERIRGYALAQLGRSAEASVAFEASLARARAGGGMQFDQAMALDALVRLQNHMGVEASTGLEAERTELFEQLGIMVVAEIPLEVADVRVGS